MLSIRRSQMQALAESSRTIFCGRLTELLRKAYSRAAETPDLPERVSVAVRAAESFGLTWESAIADFVALATQFGPEFHQSPLVNAILTRTDVPPNQRIGELFQSLSTEDWAAVRRSSKA